MTAIFNWARNAISGFIRESAQEEEEIPLHTWKIGKRELRLLQKRDRLDCLVIDRATREKWRVDPPLNSRPLQERITHLLQSEPIIGNDYSVVFSKRTDHPEWPRRQFADGRTIALAQQGNDLIWRQFSEKESSTILALEDISNLGIYLSELPEQVRGRYWENFEPQVGDKNISDEQISSSIKARCLQNIPLEKRIAYFKDFEIVWYERASKLSSVILKKISALSRIDNRTPIDRNHWTVTVLCCGQDWHGHAVIAYEGIKEGKPFLNYAHLTGEDPLNTSKGKVEWIEEGQKNWRLLKYQGRTGTWLRKRHEVQAIERSIQWEISQQEKGKTSVYFNLLGAGSFFKSPIITTGINWNYLLDKTLFSEGEFVFPYIAQPHNCITWSAQKLKLAGIELPLVERSHIFTLPTEYIGLSTEEQKNQESPRFVSEIDSSEHLLSLLNSEKIETSQEVDENKVKELEYELIRIERELQKPIASHERLTLEATQRLNSPLSLNAEEIADMTYVEEARAERAELICRKKLLELCLCREKFSLAVRNTILHFKRAEEEGNLEKMTRLKRLYLAYFTFIECNHLSDMVLTDLYWRQIKSCALYQKQLGEAASSNRLSYFISHILPNFS